MKTPKTTRDGKGACLPAVSAVPTSCMAHSHGGRADCAYLTKVTPYLFLILSLTKGPLHSKLKFKYYSLNDSMRLLDAYKGERYTRSMNIGICGTGIYEPEQIQYVKDVRLSERLTQDRIAKNGVEQLRIASRDEHPSEMAVKAAKRAIQNAEINPEDIDLVVYTQAFIPDHLVWPDYAEIQAKIGAQNANSLKILQQCNGQIASLDYIRSKMLSDNDINLALVVAAEKYSKPLINRWNSNLLFWGDGASAAVIKKSQKVNNTILFSKLITDGTYNRIWQASLKGGTVLPFSHKTKLAKNEMLADFFRFGAKYQYDDSERKKITDLMCSKNNQIISTILKANMKIDKIVTVNREVSWINDIANKFNVDINNTSAYLVKDYAHMGACDIIFNFHKMLLDYKIKEKDKVLLLSVGAGYSAGIILLEFM